MKAHLIDTHGTKVKVICKGQGQISGSCFSKDGHFGGSSVSQTHLDFTFILSSASALNLDQCRIFSLGKEELILFQTYFII